MGNAGTNPLRIVDRTPLDLKEPQGAGTAPGIASPTAPRDPMRSDNMPSTSRKRPLVGVLSGVVAWCALASTAHAVAPFVLETVDGGPGQVVGEYASMKLDRQGRPHIAYYDGANGHLKYARFDGSRWQIQVADPSVADVGQFAALALDSLDHPHIAYHDDTNGKLRYATLSGTTWTRELADPSSFDCGWYPSIAVDRTQKVWIASYDRGMGNPRLSRRTAPNTWTGQDLDGSYDLSGFWSSIAVDDSLRAHIAWYNLTRGRLEIADQTRTGWTVSVVDSSTADVGLYCAMVMDRTGGAHIAYMDLVHFDLKYANRVYTGGPWVRQTLDTSSDMTGYDCSIALRPSGAPVIAYHDATRLKPMLAQRAGNSWSRMLVDDAPGVTGLYTSVGCDNRGLPCLSYWDGSAMTLRFAHLSTGVLDAPAPRPGIALTLSPNPARAGREVRLSAPAGIARVEVLDVAGRRVAEVSLDATGHGQWDARAHDGAALRAGLYFARPLRADGEGLTATPIVITH